MVKEESIDTCQSVTCARCKEEVWHADHDLVDGGFIHSDKTQKMQNHVIHRHNLLPYALRSHTVTQMYEEDQEWYCK